MGTATIAEVQTDGLTKRQIAFKRKVLNPFLFKLFLLKDLPMAFLSGIRVTDLNQKTATTKIKFGWLTQNPFRSTYFACLGMAGEMAQGLMVLMAVEGHRPTISTLPVAMDSEFLKKATGVTTFTCEDGEKIFAAVNEAIRTQQGVSIKTLSTGRNSEGEEVAKFWVTWSIKQKPA